MFNNFGFMALILKISPMVLKFIKSVKVIKVALAGGSMLAYSYLFTWEFAAILILSIVFHEYGHITGMKRCGMKTKGIFLIPFMGGAAVPESDFKNRRDETYVALMGPLYGLLLTFPFLVYGVAFDSALSIGLVSFMALINLFNLVPINPLDGGRVLKSIAFSVNSVLGLSIMVLGIILAAFAVYHLEIWLLMFIIAIGSFELFFEYMDYKRARRKDGAEDFLLKNMEKLEVAKYSLYYLGLIAAFVGLVFYAASFDGADLALKLLKDNI